MKKNNQVTAYFKKISFACVLLSSLYSVQALTVSPARLEVNVDPGVASQNEFTLINEEDADQTFYTSVENFEAQGESGTPNFIKGGGGLSSWVQVTPSITIKKGEKVKIPFTINVPQDADAGGHFAAIFLSTIPPDTKGGEVAVGAKVGMLILVRVSGAIKEEGGVTSFTLKDGGRMVTTLPIDLVYRFNNNGNDRAKPIGEIKIKNMFGINTQTLDANNREGNVLPNSIRRFEVRWGEGEAPLASESFFTFVKYEMKNFALGFYFADLDLTFGTSGKTSSSLYFFVFPWHLIIVILVILVILYIVFSFMLKRYNQFIIRQARLMNSGHEKTVHHKKK